MIRSQLLNNTIISLFTCSAIFSVKWRPQIPFLPCSIQQTTLHQTVLPCIFSPSPEPFDLQRYWTSMIEGIDGELQKAIPSALPTNSTESNEIVLAKGKGASPIICIAACEAVGGSKEQALPTACALQMIHTASQIHHDLPCIDDQPICRGQPSTHIVFGVDMAVWAADALFPLGFEYIVSATSQVPADRVVRGIAQGMQGPWDLRGSLLGSIWTRNGESLFTNISLE